MLFIPISLVTAEAREKGEARLISTFRKECGWYQNGQQYLATKLTADNDSLNTPEWHKNYPLHYTDVFGKLTCFVTSKILGREKERF